MGSRSGATQTSDSQQAGEHEVSLRRKWTGLILGPAVFVLLLALPAPEGFSENAWSVAAVAALLAIWWLTEAIPLAATALLPLALFPLLGVATIDDAAAPYADPIVFLFLGGFIIGLAIERANLHRRIALNIVLRVGAREDMQIAGFMIATAALSMWVSNTATTVMMLPVALSVIPRNDDGSVEADKRVFATVLMLSVAYAANIGGAATIIGTPPNAFLVGFMSNNYGVDIGFGQWMLIGLPLALTMLVCCWWLLTRVLHDVNRGEVPGAREAIRHALDEMGPASTAERRVGIVFGVTALLWIGRTQLNDWIPGLALSDPGIAIAGAIALFLIPSGEGAGRTLMTWHNAERLPWGVLLLFGGGLSLAAAVSNSGLAESIGSMLTAFESWPSFTVIIAVALLVIFLTELTSNIATTATFLPIVAALAVSIGEPALLLAIPAVLAASYAFMMPVATPPNAIVFSSGYIRVPQMVRAGIWLNAVGVIMIMIFLYLLMSAVFAV